jgi:TilS substrate binding domain
LLPLLEDLNPNIIETIANTAGLMQNLQEACSGGIHSPVADELVLADVKELSKPRLYETIRTWLHRHRGTMRQLQLKHIEAIERLILSERSGRVAEIPGGCVVKSAGKLRYKENKVEN